MVLTGRFWSLKITIFLYVELGMCPPWEMRSILIDPTAINVSWRFVLRKLIEADLKNWSEIAIKAGNLWQGSKIALEAATQPKTTDIVEKWGVLSFLKCPQHILKQTSPFSSVFKTNFGSFTVLQCSQNQILPFSSRISAFWCKF